MLNMDMSGRPIVDVPGIAPDACLIVLGPGLGCGQGRVRGLPALRRGGCLLSTAG